MLLDITAPKITNLYAFGYISLSYMAVYDLVESIFNGERIEIATKNGLSKYIGPKILNDVMYV